DHSHLNLSRTCACDGSATAGTDRRLKKGSKERSVSEIVADLCYELAGAKRILAHQKVQDAFSHVSARHPQDPGRYLLSRSRAPQLVESSDILEFTLESEPIRSASTQLYSERVIHGEIYKARPDVMAVCHHHCPAVMPFCIAGEALVPVF